MEKKIHIPGSLAAVMNMCANCVNECCGAEAYNIRPIVIGKQEGGAGKTLLKEARREIAGLFEQMEGASDTDEFAWNNIVGCRGWWTAWLKEWDAAIREGLSIRPKGKPSRPFEQDTAKRTEMASKQKKTG